MSKTSYCNSYNRLPLHKAAQTDNCYDIFPTHHLSDGKILEGYDSLAQVVGSHKTIVVDSFEGVDTEVFRECLDRALQARGIDASWHNTASAMKDEAEIERMIAPFMGGDDPLFGFRTTLCLSDFFDNERLEALAAAKTDGVNIYYGIGAGLLHVDGFLIYVDLPKNELQCRSRAGMVQNLGAKQPMPPKKMYKRFYFVDWVVLGRHKKELLPNIDVIVDGQNPDMAVFMTGDDLRNSLDLLSENAFRVRPWFEPGVWGGQWMKRHFKQLDQTAENFAWSFELIVPENGIVFESQSRMIEVSFEWLMYRNARGVVGKECFDRYGDEFPIRLDYLDNVRGGNLSIQCHPRLEYIQKNFGEVLTQEETYYVMDTTDNAVVYLGFKDDIEPQKFRNALTESFEQCKPFDVDRYVNHLPSVKHSLYLIPPGTLHSSGKGNVVLEISTTPYIFTFKMYDWLSLDLDGKPRPINIDRAMENLYFDRKGERMANEFVSHPSVICEGDGWSIEHLPTHPNHSYDVNRLTVEKSVEVETQGRFNALNLVEGQQAEIVTASGFSYPLRYAETVVVAADAQSYRIINRSKQAIKVLSAFMKQ